MERSVKKDIAFLNEMKSRLEEYQSEMDSTQLEMVFQMIDDWREELKLLRKTKDSCSFSAEDMIKAYDAGSEDIYECRANGKDKKCYCRRTDECDYRQYRSAEEWLKNYKNEYRKY